MQQLAFFVLKMMLNWQNAHTKLEAKKYYNLIQNMLTTQLFFLIIVKT